MSNHPLQYAKTQKIQFDDAGCCCYCIQAMIEIVFPYDIDYNEIKTDELCLPPKYSEPNKKGEYMSIFCKIKHRNINYCVKSCSDYMSLDMAKQLEEEENG